MTIARALDVQKRLTQVGQLKAVMKNNFGATVITSVNTVSCCVFVENRSQNPGDPTIVVQPIEVAIFGPDIDVKMDDHLVNVVDTNGLSVFIGARRVALVRDYNHPRRGREFRYCELKAASATTVTTPI